MSPILAATDFSPPAEQAVARAATFARQFRTTLHLLHVLPPISWKAFGKALIEHPLVTEKQLYDAARTRLDNVADACRTQYGIEVTSHVDIGRPHVCIADFARTHAVGLTVLGPHAGNFARDLFIGSTAYRFLREGSAPALIAQPAGQAPYRTVLVAVDFSDISHAAIEAAQKFAPGAAIHALHVYDVLFEGKMRYAGVEDDVIQQYRAGAETEARGMMQQFLAERGWQESIIPAVRNGYPPRTIRDEADSLRADLIVMGKHGRSALQESFLGSVTEAVLHGLDRDLLVVAEQKT